MSTGVKSTLRALVYALMRGQRGGLSPFGLRLEKFARYLVFVARDLRLSFVNRPASRVSSAHTLGLGRPEILGTIYDVGANNGDDVAYYLKKADRVVAIEANPALAEHIKSRFPDDFHSGKLVVLNLAVGSEAGRARFFLALDNDKISTLGRPVESRSQFKEIEVDVRTLSSVVKEYGEAVYVKVDIEGVDAEVLHEIFSAGCKPNYISAELQSIDVLCEYFAAGYRKFKIVEGKFVHRRYGEIEISTSQGALIKHEFPPGSSSGPFGDDLAGEWMSADEVFHYLSEYGLGWKDIHASR